MYVLVCNFKGFSVQMMPRHPADLRPLMICYFQGDLNDTQTTCCLKPLWCMVQCLRQDLETGCLKLAVVKCLGVKIFKGDHNILIFQP